MECLQRLIVKHLKDLYGITPSVYRKQFQKNLKYNKENKGTKKCIWIKKQIALIQHLINDHHLYQDEYLDIDKRKSTKAYNLFKNIDQLSLLQENKHFNY